MYYVKWLGIILCALSSCVECRPDINTCDARKADCRYEIESQMHYSPKSSSSKNDHMQRNKRTKVDSSSKNDYQDEKSSYFWQSRAQFQLRSHLARKRYNKVDKIFFFFLGDGMSIPTLAAARVYLSELRGYGGEESSLSFERFPYVGLSKTYCVNKQVPDSACTATAYLCGVKANFQTIGVNGRVQLDDCKAASNSSNQVSSLLSWAQNAGKATGVVTTTTVTHASPSGNYAHTSNRLHESDGDVVRAGSDVNECEDIASQLIRKKPGKDINVILGGGRSKFLPKTIKDFESIDGEREDGKNLIAEWEKNKPKGKIVFDRDGLIALDTDTTDDVLGLFSSGHMDYNVEANHTKQPTLLEMTETAIGILKKEDNGFFLFVEGGRIDHGHHAAQAIKALDETVQFSNAIKRAVELTSSDDTLIVVTSDHAHTMSIAGYPDRGNPISGLNTVTSDVDNLPTLTLSYANGPGYDIFKDTNGARQNISGIEINSNFTYPGTFPSRIESHGGDDVGVFALGCMSHLFTGVYEQNVIPHLISYASCIGDGLTACKQFD